MPESRLTTLDLELCKYHIKFELNLNIGGIIVTTGAARLRTFLKGLTCVKCGLTASFGAVDITYEKKRPHYHLNLYALKSDGTEEMMTSDHIHPKSRGGGGGLTNRQPMCRTCNLEKGSKVE